MNRLLLFFLAVLFFSCSKEATYVKVTFVETNSLTPIPNLGVKIKKVDIWHSDSEVLEELTTDETGSIYFPKSKIHKKRG